MSVLELVADETRRLSRSARLPMLFVPLGAGAALLTAGAMWLARGRWLDLPAAVTRPNLRDLDLDQLAGRAIRTGRHCFGCTAGAGSSCGGATT